MHATSPKARNPGFTNGIADIRHVMHVRSLKMEETIVQAAKKLEYTHVRKEQMKVIISFANRNDRRIRFFADGVWKDLLLLCASGTTWTIALNYYILYIPQELFACTHFARPFLSAKGRVPRLVLYRLLENSMAINAYVGDLLISK